jgi:hypothetical protein
MAFPLSYKNNIQSNYFARKTENYNEQILLQEILKSFSSFNFTDLEINQNSFSFVSKNSLISFKYKLDVNIQKVNVTKDVYKVDYEFQTTSLFTITLIITIFSAFFSSFSFIRFVIFTALLSISFYLINILFVNYLIRRSIKTISIFRTIVDDENELEERQEEWFKDITKCPACGETVSETDNSCNACGLKLGKKKYYEDLDSSKFTNSKIEYHYTPGKKNKHN